MGLTTQYTATGEYYCNTFVSNEANMWYEAHAPKSGAHSATLRRHTYNKGHNTHTIESIAQFSLSHTFNHVKFLSLFSNERSAHNYETKVWGMKQKNVLKSLTHTEH